MIPSRPPRSCRKKTRKRRSKSATRKINVGHDVSCPFSVWACVRLLLHESHAPHVCLLSSLCSVCFSSCRRIGGQACCKSLISCFRWNLHDQIGEQRDL